MSLEQMRTETAKIVNSEPALTPVCLSHVERIVAAALNGYPTTEQAVQLAQAVIRPYCIGGRAVTVEQVREIVRDEMLRAGVQPDNSPPMQDDAPPVEGELTATVNDALMAEAMKSLDFAICKRLGALLAEWKAWAISQTTGSGHPLEANPAAPPVAGKKK